MQLKYWTARLFWYGIIADGPEESGGDADENPDTKGINGGVTITPTIARRNSQAVRAQDLTPHPALLALAPFEVRLDAGQLKRTASQADVRLVAKSDVLDLPDDVTIWYNFRPHHITYNGQPQQLPEFTVPAPTIDADHDDDTDGEVVVDLAIAEWIENSFTIGSDVFLRQVPDDVRLNDDNKVVFSAAGVDIGDPLDLTVSVTPDLTLEFQNIVGNYETETLALFDRMTVRPDFDHRHAINTLIAALKDYDLWTRLDGLYVFAAHTQQAALLNWRRTSANFTAVNSPTFTADVGFTGDGVSSSLTNVNSATVHTQATDGSVSLWVATADTTQGSIQDLWWTGWGYAIDSARTSTASGWISPSSYSTTRGVTSIDTGLFTVVQANNDHAYFYLEGAQIDSIVAEHNIASLSYSATTPIRILSSNGSTNFVNSTVSFASYGAAMSGPEAALFYNAVNDYMTAVGLV